MRKARTKTASFLAGAAPARVTGALVLGDGTVFKGIGIGAAGTRVGEVCFNTSITGYQEILTDPSYAGQIITFTFPHIGNVGANPEDIETQSPAARGLVLREDITQPSNYRSHQHLNDWLKSHDLVGIAGIDTRRLTRLIREKGAAKAALQHAPDNAVDIDALRRDALAWPGLEGMDLAREVSCRQAYEWTESCWSPGAGYAPAGPPRHHVVAIDYGAKHNILRCLASLGCRVSVVPATASAKTILGLAPDGIFLSNGPGDPRATGEYAAPVIQTLLKADLPVFGICLGHQMLALALGARTVKMHHGHRGANHPVKDLATGRVEITSQNHGFTVVPQSLPDSLEPTHVSLFDGSLEGLRMKARPVFSVQYHPEASPGPRDSFYLFKRFVASLGQHA